MLMKRFFFIAIFISIIFSLNAQTNLNLLSEAEKDGITVYWDSLSGTGVLEKSGHQISFKADDPFVLQDYKKIVFVDAPILKNGTLYVSRKFITDANVFFKQEFSGSEYKVGAIVIDAGHGGQDPGAYDTYTVNGKKITIKEKEVTLKVSKMIYNRLKQAYPDKKILMTRDKDIFLELEERTEIANSIKLKDHEAILFVSIHANANPDKKASGYEVWYLSPDYRRNVLEKNSKIDNSVYNILNSMTEEEYTTESILIAKFIMDGIQAQIGNKSIQRGIKAYDWFVVRNAKMPSVLVELGFITNQNEAMNLLDDDYLQKLSLGIYNGLSAFVTHFERSHGFTGAK